MAAVHGDNVKRAKVHLLTEFTEISYIVEYAKLFQLDPDDVYLKVFDTVVYILTYERSLADFKARLKIIQDNDSPPRQP